MSKSRLIRLLYSIFLSVFIVAVGIALICAAAEIYYSGTAEGAIYGMVCKIAGFVPTHVIYTPEIVRKHLLKLAIPLILLIALIIAGVIFPVYENKAGRIYAAESTLKKLQRKIPASGEGAEFEQAARGYRKLKKVKIIVWCTALAIALAGAVGTLIYLCRAANFKGSDYSGHMLALVRVVLPFTVSALAAFISASSLNGYFCKRQADHIKTMIKYGSRETALPKELEVLDKVKTVASHKITLWVARSAVFVVAVAFIIAGVFNGGANDVLVKAINICSECIGIG